MAESDLSRKPQHRILLWISFIAFSAALSAMFAALGVPAALLIGPMLAGIVFALRGVSLATPKPLFVAGQALVGCLVARYFEPGVLSTLALDWPLFAGITLAVLCFSVLLGYLLTRGGIVPGQAAIWGSVPGGAAPMVLLAQAHGADPRLVAVMTYSRVVVVVLIASVLLALFGDHGSPPTVPAQSWTHFDPYALVTTMAVAALGLALGTVLRLPAGPLLGTLIVGAALNMTHPVALAPPRILLAFAYAVIGWRIGLSFTRDTVRDSVLALPAIILSSLVLVGFCMGLGFIMMRQLGVDPVTAYLATSPGGLDSMAIMAASMHSNVALVMAMQTLRFLVAVLAGPPLTKWLVGYENARMKRKS